MVNTVEGGEFEDGYGWAWYGNVTISNGNVWLGTGSKIRQYIRCDGSASQKLLSIPTGYGSAFYVSLDGTRLGTYFDKGTPLNRAIPTSYTGEVLVEIIPSDSGELDYIRSEGIASAGVRAYAKVLPGRAWEKTAISFFDATSEFVNTSWLWDFGDGVTATEQNPTHSYESSGEYTATLTTENGTKKILVNIIDSTPVVSIKASGKSGVPPYSVTFDSSSGSNYIPGTGVWDFGDGSTSNEINPVHSYTKDGTFTATFTVTNGGKTVSKSITITTRTPKPPVVDFSITPREGLTVDFEDLSENIPTGWTWDFGEDPTKIKKTAHTYAVPGTYNVKLTATNADGTGTVTKNIAVTVAEPAQPIPVANFSSSVPVASSPLNLLFSDQSTNIPTSWSWDFGDGKTSTQKNPSHVYSIAGTYQVKLTVTNEYGTAETTKAIIVTAPVITWSINPEKVPVNTTARITLKASGFKSGSKIRITQPENIGVVSKIISISSTQIVFDFLFDELFTGACGISVIPTSGTVKTFDNAITVE